VIKQPEQDCDFSKAVQSRNPGRLKMTCTSSKNGVGGWLLQRWLTICQFNCVSRCCHVLRDDWKNGSRRSRLGTGHLRVELVLEPSQERLPPTLSRLNWKIIPVSVLLVTAGADYLVRGPIRFFRNGSQWSDITQVDNPSRAWIRGIDP
jgi:hypothetical protein